MYRHIVPHRRGFAVDHGLGSGCPFCAARQDLHPAVGTSILFLSGIYVGQVGVVCDNKGWEAGDGKFQARLNFDPEGHRTVVDPSLELFVNPAAVEVPDWMPALSIEDCCGLHEEVLESLRFFPQGNNRQAAAKVVKGLASLAWHARLPVNGNDIWNLLAAHGARPELKIACMELYDFGLSLLVGALGRPPNRRKRMEPLSQGRYLTKKGRAKRLEIFGYA